MANIKLTGSSTELALIGPAVRVALEAFGLDVHVGQTQFPMGDNDPLREVVLVTGGDPMVGKRVR